MDLSRPITLHLPSRVEIGAGCAARLGGWAEGCARILVIASRSTGAMVDHLDLPGAPTIHAAVPPEPRDTDLEAALAVAREARPDLIVGLGGGSVMGVAKLVSVLWEDGRPPAAIAGPNNAQPRVCALAQVATTAGTGSEAGIRALFTSTETGMKVAVESADMLADLAVLDPELTMSVPRATTAVTGVDALAHCVEAFTSRRAHPLVDGAACMGIALVGRYLPHAVADGLDAEARAGMLLAAFYGGLCLGPVNTAAGQAVAYPLGTRGALAHGLANALVFPHVLAFNAPACEARTAEVLRGLSLVESAEPKSVAEAVAAWCRGLGIAMSLTAHGITEADLAAYAAEAYGIRRLMDFNPREMSIGDVEAVYRAAF